MTVSIVQTNIIRANNNSTNDSNVENRQNKSKAKALLTKYTLSCISATIAETSL